MLNKKTSSLVALVLLIAAVYLLLTSFKKKGADKPADKPGEPDGDKKPSGAGEESGYLLTGVKCACKDEYGNIYRGDEMLLGDGSRVCLCPDYFAIYGYPYWWGGYYGWRYPGRRWHGGGHRRPHGGGGHHPGPAPVRVRPVTTGMRAPMGGGMRGGMGGGRMGGGGRGR
jgi:hypothetical protein